MNSTVPSVVSFGTLAGLSIWRNLAILQMSDKKLPLTIFLLKPDRVPVFESQLETEIRQSLPLAAPLDGYVISFPSKPIVPLWASILNNLLQKPGSLSAVGSSPAALMVIKQDSHTFVLSFGHAWRKLEDDWLQPDFGRRVALNTILPTKLIEIHLEQVFARWHVARERAPQASSVEEFGVEFDRDLVASIEGLPQHKGLGKKIRGGTSLRVEIDLASLSVVLEKAATLSKSLAYRKNWPEIDNVSVVVDQVLIGRLEAQFDGALKGDEAQNSIVMFAPTDLLGEAAEVNSYVFGRMSKRRQAPPT